MMKLFIGLGNPDEQYQNTRHNIGFSFIDYIAKKGGFNSLELNKKLNALTSKSKVESTQIVISKPLSYVNKTGEVAVKLKNFYKIKPESIIIVQDDLDIEFGEAKLSFDKNSGGHKGVESVIKSLKTKEFYRLRIGVSTPSLRKARRSTDKRRDAFVMDFVLSKFSKGENEKIKLIFKEAYSKLEQGGIIK